MYPSVFHFIFVLLIDSLTMLGYITFIMTSLHSSNYSTRILKSVEEDALELGDLERSRKQCFLYMQPKKHFF